MASTKLTERIRCLTKEKVDYIYCLDDSRSISDDDWKEMISAVEEMVISLSNNERDSKFACVTFHGLATKVSAFQEAVQLINSLKSYKRRKGSTNTLQGIQECASLHSQRRPGAKIITIIITDGDYTGPDPAKAALELRLKDVTIIVLGVGPNVSDKKATDLCCGGCFFKINNFLELKNSLSLHTATPNVTRDFEATVIFKDPKVLPGFTCGLKNERISIPISIRNQGSKVIPSGSVLRFPPTSGTHTTVISTKEDLKMEQQTTLCLDLSIKASEFIDLPNAIPFSFKTPVGYGIHCGEDQFHLKSEWFVRFFERFDPSKVEENTRRYNIMMFGIAGSGKSSFINRLLTAMKDSIQTGAVFGGGADHTTKSIQKFDLPFEDVMIPVTLCDTWGLDGDNYSRKFLGEVLKGKIPDGFSMADVSCDAPSFSDDALCWKNRVHALLIFVPMSIRRNPKLLCRICENYRYATEEKFSPIVIVTQIDPLKIHEQDELRKTLANEMRVPEERFFMIKNYTTETEKSFKMDKQSLHILKCALQDAEAHIKNHLCDLGKKLFQQPSITNL